MRQKRDELAATNERLASENGLLNLYLYDTQRGVDPIVVRKGSVRANLYRATGASGGYVVIRTTEGDSVNTWIRGFEEAYHECTHSEWSFTPENEDYRTVIERCRIERQRKLDAQMVASRAISDALKSEARQHLQAETNAINGMCGCDGESRCTRHS